MSRNNILNLLYKELLTESTKLQRIKETNPSEVVHYTDFNGLYGILKDGVIEARDYFDKAVNNPEALEISTLRRSVDADLMSSKKRNDKLKSLTENADGVKIYLFEKNIIASVRSATKKPVSEFYVFFSKEVEESLDNLMNNIFPKNNIKIERSRMVSFAKRYLTNIIKVPKEQYKEVMNKLKKSHTPISKHLMKTFKEEFREEIKDVNDIGSVLQFVRMMIWTVFSSSITREGEERIVFNKRAKKGKTGIPVSPKFMKIRIEKGVTAKKVYDSLYEEDGTLSRLLKLMKKNKEVFIDNEDYYNLIKDIEEYIDNNRVRV